MTTQLLVKVEQDMVPVLAVCTEDGLIERPRHQCELRSDVTLHHRS